MDVGLLEFKHSVGYGSCILIALLLVVALFLFLLVVHFRLQNAPCVFHYAYEFVFAQFKMVVSGHAFVKEDCG